MTMTDEELAKIAGPVAPGFVDRVSEKTIEIVEGFPATTEEGTNAIMRAVADRVERRADER